MRKNLLQWQWSLYPDGHQSRVNLVLHLVTVPLFMLGTVFLVAGVTRPLFALVAPVFLLPALVFQGHGHRGETTRPVPFTGATDFLTRFFVEQWFTFPRYVLTGGLSRAWRGGDQTRPRVARNPARKP